MVQRVFNLIEWITTEKCRLSINMKVKLRLLQLITCKDVIVKWKVTIPNTNKNEKFTKGA